jgi:hypothetical protein
MALILRSKGLAAEVHIQYSQRGDSDEDSNEHQSRSYRLHWRLYACGVMGFEMCPAR